MQQVYVLSLLAKWPCCVPRLRLQDTSAGWIPVPLLDPNDLVMVTKKEKMEDAEVITLLHLPPRNHVVLIFSHLIKMVKLRL